MGIHSQRKWFPNEAEGSMAMVKHQICSYLLTVLDPHKSTVITASQEGVFSLIDR